MLRALLIAVLSLASLGGCGPKLIPGTSIADTDPNRQILAVVETYRSRLEARDVDGLVKLVAADFFERSGTPEASDDYDREGLRQKLSDWATRTKAVRVELTVKKIALDGAAAKLRYFYDLNYQVAVAEGPPAWKRDSDSKEMTLRREGGTWLIVGGI